LNKQIILDVAVKLAETRGYENVFKRNIAFVLGCSMGTINYHWETMDTLRIAIIHEAIRLGNRAIVMQAVARRDPVLHHNRLSPTLRIRLNELNVTL
jgi:DNA-binding transcriptional regulator YbjK